MSSSDSSSEEETHSQDDIGTRQENFDHFNPTIRPGSDHDCDEEWVDPPAYKSDEESDDLELDNTFYANLNHDRLNRPVDEWCSCGGCVTMAT